MEKMTEQQYVELIAQIRTIDQNVNHLGKLLEQQIETLNASLERVRTRLEHLADVIGMNGGDDGLSGRLIKLEATCEDIETKMKWIFGVGGGLIVAVLGQLAVLLIQHILK